mgnify:CR=1 FL=1
MNFNPRPCARGDHIALLKKPLFFDISIHAPARGATKGKPKKDAFTKISIHAPARGATFDPDAVWDALKFQSTPLREGRL